MYFLSTPFVLCNPYSKCVGLNQCLCCPCLPSVVEFKDEEFVKKAVDTMNKHDLSGRPLNIKEVWTIGHNASNSMPISHINVVDV